MIDACHYAHHKDQITARPSFLSFVLLLLRCCSMPLFFVSALLSQSLLFHFRNLPQIKSVWFTFLCLFLNSLQSVFDMYYILQKISHWSPRKPFEEKESVI